MLLNKSPLDNCCKTLSSYNHWSSITKTRKPRPEKITFKKAILRVPLEWDVPELFRFIITHRFQKKKMKANSNMHKRFERQHCFYGILSLWRKFSARLLTSDNWLQKVFTRIYAFSQIDFWQKPWQFMSGNTLLISIFQLGIHTNNLYLCAVP